MELYRKYFDDAQLRVLAEQTPSWGVDILTIGHNLHQPKKEYPDPNHPNHYYFDWNKGRMLDEFQLVYIANGQGVFESETAPRLRSWKAARHFCCIPVPGIGSGPMPTPVGRSSGWVSGGITPGI